MKDTHAPVRCRNGAPLLRPAPTRRSTSTAILIVDDDLDTLETLAAVLHQAGLAVTTCESGQQAAAAMTQSDFSLVLLDLRLGAENGLDVLVVIHRIRPETPIVVFTAFGSIQSAVEAVKLGAADYLEKPLVGEDLVDLVKRFIGAESVDARASAAHAGGRWAQAVIGVVHSAEDPRTVSEWGQAIGAGAGTVRNWCHTARLSPKRSLTLARLLRALYLSRSRKWVPEQLLNIVDRRTLNRMLAQGGVDRMTAPTIDGFLRLQTLIGDRATVNELRKALRSTGEPALHVDAA
jgi:ActR/RegA family two-component response regulator